MCSPTWEDYSVFYSLPFPWLVHTIPLNSRSALLDISIGVKIEVSQNRSTTFCIIYVTLSMIPWSLWILIPTGRRCRTTLKLDKRYSSNLISYFFWRESTFFRSLFLFCLQSIKWRVFIWLVIWPLNKQPSSEEATNWRPSSRMK
jgi:hypothetical protein